MGTAVGQWLEEAMGDRRPNIIGKPGESIIAEYLQRRGYKEPSSHSSNSPGPELQMYVKTKFDYGASSGTKKPFKTPKVGTSSNPQAGTAKATAPAHQDNPKKKKGGKLISLAEAAKGSIVFQQGKTCACQGRRHKLVRNCLSCGKIVCEQEGEGPCNFCGALVLKEGSTYNGLEEGFTPVSVADVAAEAYAKRNSAARTTVIDDQSDYYEGKWLSGEEKELLRKKREEIEDVEQVKKSKVVMTFDLVGFIYPSHVLLNEDDISELESRNRILGPGETKNVNRIKPNPTAKLIPIFLEPGLNEKKPNMCSSSKRDNKKNRNGLCLEITGRVQHDRSELKYLQADPSSVIDGLHVEDGGECSLDYD
ncbi:hypothetical protein N665_1553s0001 [Sinapis alba]|nr:hypothetical protein N665_1553s0001 [Sinapis alba]